MGIKVVGSNLVHKIPVRQVDGGGGEGSATVDSELSLVSENPVQNKVITEHILNLENSVNYELDGDEYPTKHILQDTTDSVRLVGQSSLDNIAFDNLSFRDLFITNNLITNGSFSDGTLNGWEVNSGNPTINSAVFNTRRYALKCFGDTSQQLRQSIALVKNHHYMFGAFYRAVRVDTGYVGVGLSGAFARTATVSDHFKIGYNTFVPSKNDNYSFFVGTISSANADGYIDDAFCLDLEELFPNVDFTVQENRLIAAAKILLAAFQYTEIVNNDTITVGREHLHSKMPFVTSVLYATSDIARFISTKIALIIAERKLLGLDTTFWEDRLPYYATNVSVTTLPEHPSMYRQQQPEPIYALNGDSSAVPASVTKVVSILTALPYITSIKNSYTITSDDIHSGSGNVFQAGDVVTVEDLLYAMMLPSSNTAAHALGHYVGKIILGDSATAQECETAFVNAMNSFMLNIGATNSTFVTPSGLASGNNQNSTTANDMLKVGIEAASWDILNRVWNVNSYTINVSGTNARQISLTSTVQSSALEDDYIILGGKTGTLTGIDPEANSLLSIVESKKYTF